MALSREQLAQRVAQELKDGYYVNLGIGIPTLVANYVPEGIEVMLQSENGLLGMGQFPTEDEIDADLINAGKQITAMAYGADACYTARGFMLALGCIQSLLCNKNTCPVGITTHDPRFQKGLIIEDKAQRVANYVKNLNHDSIELLAATGRASAKELNTQNLHICEKEAEP